MRRFVSSLLGLCLLVQSGMPMASGTPDTAAVASPPCHGDIGHVPAEVTPASHADHETMSCCGGTCQCIVSCSGIAGAPATALTSDWPGASGDRVAPVPDARFVLPNPPFRPPIDLLT